LAIFRMLAPQLRQIEINPCPGHASFQLRNTLSHRYDESLVEVLDSSEKAPPSAPQLPAADSLIAVPQKFPALCADPIPAFGQPQPVQCRPVPAPRRHPSNRLEHNVESQHPQHLRLEPTRASEIPHHPRTGGATEPVLNSGSCAFRASQ